MTNLKEALSRGIAMEKVKCEAEELLREYQGRIETSKPEIISNLNEFALEDARIRLRNVIIWDQGTIDVDFGELL